MAPPELDRDEYIEQAYFFRVYRERIDENIPAQEVLTSLSQELLATTRLPTAVEFLDGEMHLHGRISDGMRKLPHYFTAFQCYVMDRAEEEGHRFDVRQALEVLQREAEAKAEDPSPAALFVYQFECLARNQLGYDLGLAAIAQDQIYNDDWREWISSLRRQLGEREFADLVYQRSQLRVDEIRRRTGNPEYCPDQPVLFGVQEGRIAKAHHGRDPLFMFSALQRHLNYPAVPRLIKKKAGPAFAPAVELRFQKLEGRVALLEAEVKGGLDLTQFYKGPDSDKPAGDFPAFGNDIPG